MTYYKDDCNISIPQTLLQCNQEIPHWEVESNYCLPPWIWAGLSDSLTANRLWQKSWPGKHIQHPPVPPVIFGPWMMLPLKILPSCKKKSKPHAKAMGRCSSQQPQLSPALKLCQSRSQACWMIPTPGIWSPPAIWGSWAEVSDTWSRKKTSPLHCSWIPDP